METRANYALIGAFVLIATMAVAVFTLWLGQSQFRQDFEAYDIVFEGPVSLEQGASVRYIGIKVGEVSWVRIDRGDQSKVRARIRVDAETPVKVDSTASIQLAGITEVLGKANRTIERVNLILTDENIESLSATIRNIETLSGQLAASDGTMAQATQTLKDVSAASARFEAASASLESFGTNADSQMTEFGSQANALVAEIREVAASANKTVEQSNLAVLAATDAIEGPATGALVDARLASRDLRLLINRLDRVARELEQNPQGFVVGDPAPYEESR